MQSPMKRELDFFFFFFFSSGDWFVTITLIGFYIFLIIFFVKFMGWIVTS